MIHDYVRVINFLLLIIIILIIIMMDDGGLRESLMVLGFMGVNYGLWGLLGITTIYGDLWGQ